MYISPEGEMYNDTPIKYEQEHMDMMLEAGMSLRCNHQHKCHLKSMLLYA